MTFFSFIRGINVGGNNIVKMAQLKEALLKRGLKEVQTYIQSGNVISTGSSASQVSKSLEDCLKQDFKITTQVVSFSAKTWEKILSEAPPFWGNNPEWRHNMLILLDPKDLKEVLQGIGNTKPDIEKIVAGKGVLYMSVLKTAITRSNLNKLPSLPIYKLLTIRNSNTSKKLFEKAQQL